MHDGAGLHDVVAVTWCDTVLGGDREHDAVRLRVREDDGEDAALCVTVREALAEELEVAVHVCAWVPVSDRVAVGVIIAETEAVLVALPVLCVVAVDVVDNKGVCVYDAVTTTVGVQVTVEPLVADAECDTVPVVSGLTVCSAVSVVQGLWVKLRELLEVCSGVGLIDRDAELLGVPVAVTDSVDTGECDMVALLDGVWEHEADELTDCCSVEVHDHV